MIAPTSGRTVTFDCYGTLVDWEQGLLAALRPLFPPEQKDERILQAYAAAESSLEAGPYLPYREVLTRAAAMVGDSLGVSIPADRRSVLVDSITHWPAFPDTVASVTKLRTRFEVGVISNIDEDLIQAHFAAIGIPVDWVVTAQSCGTYKPSTRNFEAARERHNLKDGWLHAAQSLYHDIAPCRRLGIPCVWIDRRAGKDGNGATPVASASPDFRCRDLEGLCDLLGV